MADFKLMGIVGARPQFIKSAIVAKKFNDWGIFHTLIHTGQHYDFNMSDIFFEELGLDAPDYFLGIGSGSHGEQTGKMLIACEGVMGKEMPDMVIVYGDTNTTLAGALAAVKLNIPVAHVEAGLRSFNREIPEEISRVVVDHISTLLFAPTDTAVKNLNRESVYGEVF
jgi:UDP-GlcNAc3NAcA epimerase